MHSQSTTYTLHDYRTGDRIREATLDEYEASVHQATRDGGAGVIAVDGRDCYVDGAMRESHGLTVGQRVAGGEGEDHDTGVIWHLTRTHAYVSWDSGVATWTPIEVLA